MITEVPSDIHDAITNYFAEREDNIVTLKRFSFCGGGCINNGGKLQTSIGNFFLKWNEVEGLAGMFEAENMGLSLIRRSNSVAVPSVIFDGTTDDHQFLLLRYVVSGQRSPDYWMKFGEDLAMLHRNTGQSFGLDHDNFIGSLRQRNDQSSSWVEFFVVNRLEAQLALASKVTDAGIRRQFDALINRLPDLLYQERPSLIHGDLWSGNVMVNEDGNATVIDPAVYYGHREVDLAMTQLFGGFDSDFLQGYHASFPLQNDFSERIEIYKLYPLLVHVNLFGGAYLGQVRKILNHFA